MEILGERPVWSMSGGEMVSSLDAAYAEIARLETFTLHLIAGLETTGYTQELRAGTTARFLAFRYRIDAAKVRRDVHLATSLSKYPAVAAALPNTNPRHAAAADTAPDNGTGQDGAGQDGAGVGVLLHPAQAGAIVSALEKVPTTVPPDDLQVAEHELVELGRTHGPLQLRDAGKLFRDRLDTDGPEPAEQKAYDRESLRLKNADNSVAFNGYLANENAELFRALIHTHAKPHKTIDGALDPRSRDKRQADALTTVLATANLVLLCKRCHRDLHAGHWDIQITNGIVHVARPTWATPDPVARGRYRPPTTTPPGATAGGAAARTWPRDTDPPWITDEAATRLNPWGDDAPDEHPTGARECQEHQEPAPAHGPPFRSAGGFDPWGEGSDGGGPRGVSDDLADRGVDLWGDAVSPIPNGNRRSKPGTDAHATLNPWGDLAPESTDQLTPC